LKLIYRILSVTAAAVTAAVMITSNAFAAEHRGDCNNDKAVNSKDLLTLSSFILNEGDVCEGCGDFNGDGVVNVYDVVIYRRYLAHTLSIVPSGTWIGRDFDGTRFFSFKDGYGHYVNAETGDSMGFDFTAEDNELEFTLGTAGTTAAADIIWKNDLFFDFEWRDTGCEHLTFLCEDDIELNEPLTGFYVTGGDYSVRYFDIKGYTGSYRARFDENDKGNYCYYFRGNDIVFIDEKNYAKKAAFTRIDRDHFDLVWENGKTEHFTRREVTVKDGITYINGILIANKTYALPSTYGPGGLTPETQAAFNEMQAAAASEGLSLKVCSGFRSYDYQATLYNSYVARDGKAKADTFSARPGHSEHQTGLAADINMASDAFLNTPEAAWLAENCWKYGFIIRYPKGKEDKTGYKYEPWHVRYLGKENAKLVYESGLCLEEYLSIASSYS